MIRATAAQAQVLAVMTSNDDALIEVDPTWPDARIYYAVREEYGAAVPLATVRALRRRGWIEPLIDDPPHLTLYSVTDAGRTIPD